MSMCLLSMSLKRVHASSASHSLVGRLFGLLHVTMQLPYRCTEDKTLKCTTSYIHIGMDLALKRRDDYFTKCKLTASRTM